MAKKIIIGNWKMNPLGMEEAESILGEVISSAGDFKKVSVVVCPPFQFLERAVSMTKKKIAIGAQDCFFGDVGPYTGEVSAEMLKSAGVKYVIIGHSERRALGEDNELINKKIKSALSSGLKVVLCVGESSRDDSGEYLNFIRNQLTLGLNGIKKALLKNLLIAYEPIWAIGKNAIRPASTEDVIEMSIFIKKILTDIFGRDQGVNIPIIYGGSVDVNNSGQFLWEGKTDGLLVGRESLVPENFIKILKIANDSH